MSCGRMRCPPLDRWHTGRAILDVPVIELLAQARNLRVQEATPHSEQCYQRAVHRTKRQSLRRLRNGGLSVIACFRSVMCAWCVTFNSRSMH